ncbi:hypothetical protein [Sphingomonas crusticola]|uniref:hypothetical protein n=1 Tax=Sphingomonas crusticola TaxID=1697973 RepID=UPI0013C35464|nr:hypothetical protein [Sphingomonas crusticola]
MDKSTPTRSAKLAGLGLAAGFVGSLFMMASQKTEMRLTGRAASDTPAEAVETITGSEAADKASQQRLTTAAHFAFGSGLGVGLAALGKVPEPTRGAVFFVGAWGAGTALITVLGLSDPPTKWDAQQLATDIGHHAVYAASAAAAFVALRRLARV